jgi:uncharacterized cofD-like protein
MKNDLFSKKIVVIGGGTGTYNLLRGLKNYSVDLTAIVSMADSGGSSGVLRDEFGGLPPGDVRRSLVALSEDEIWRDIFEYRFNGDREKHNLGNLILTALEDKYGNMASAIEKASKLLNVVGKVIPVTLDNSHLYAMLENNETIKGETNIDVPKHNPELKIKKVWLEPPSFIYKKAKEVIYNSDLIVICPGDLYTSIIPNLIVRGVSEAIRESNAKKIYTCNIMTKYGETNNFKASDFVSEIEKYLGCNLDYILLNNKKPEESMLERYREEKSEFVEPNLKEDSKRKIILDDFLSYTSFSRHDPLKIARTIMCIE